MLYSAATLTMKYSGFVFRNVFSRDFFFPAFFRALERSASGFINIKTDPEFFTLATRQFCGMCG